MIQRQLKNIIQSRLFQKKAIIIVGPRQVGKTTLLKEIVSSSGKKTIYLNCDEPDMRERLESVTSVQLKALIGDAEIVSIDEAQRVKDIGITLKLIVDNLPEKQLLVTGSSALELSNSINEPLTGRKFEYRLFPFSFQELSDFSDLLTEQRLLEKRLIYGYYPDVVNNPGNEREILTNILSSYLYKDIFEFQDIRKPEIIEKLLQALALQIGSEVSFNELSQLLGIDNSTVQRYVYLLEKAFVIYHLRPFSRNVRNELKKSVKIYFYDNGIRNALITNYKPLKLRSDVGALWENFLITERYKRNSYRMDYANVHFWRTTQQQEIDYIEDRDDFLNCYEFKWNPEKKAKLSKTFSEAYPNSKLEVVNSKNYTSFITNVE
ncbi:MAG: ATP-binding protein [Petrimonas sp.]|nr:ATP-binding protein [Petrimonas sp.]